MHDTTALAQNSCNRSSSKQARTATLASHGVATHVMPAVELPAPASAPAVHAPPTPDATDAARMAQTISQQQATIELSSEQNRELRHQSQMLYAAVPSNAG